MNGRSLYYLDWLVILYKKRGPKEGASLIS